MKRLPQHHVSTRNNFSTTRNAFMWFRLSICPEKGDTRWAHACDNFPQARPYSLWQLLPDSLIQRHRRTSDTFINAVLCDRKDTHVAC